ncbi:MAG: hypothetical protein IJ736_07390, partial [Firmicutes bacterium]|nr:hypothetical protein [Bacillota bacterium]
VNLESNYMNQLFKYDVDLHFEDIGWDTYEVNASCVDNARYMAIKRVIDELGRKYANQIDLIRVYKHKTDKLLREYY